MRHGEGRANRQTQLRITVWARLRPKAQFTLPEEIGTALHVSEGDEIEFTVHEDSTVRGFASLPTVQTWYFSLEGQVGKPQASVEIVAGRGTVHGSSEAMLAHFDSLGSADA